MTNENQLVKIVEKTSIEKSEASKILDSFKGFLKKIDGYDKKARAIVITDISQTDDMKKAREIRIELKHIRTGAENVRKDLKAEVIEKGKIIEGMANIIKGAIKPIERYLDEQEKFIERIEEERLQALEDSRTALLSPYVEDTTFYDLRGMSKAGFDDILKNAKTIYDMQIKAEKKAEADRIKKEKEDEADRKRMNEENKKLKADADKRDLETKAAQKIQDKKDADVAKKLADAEEKTRKAEEALVESERIDHEKANEEAKIIQDQLEANKIENAKAVALKKEERYKKFLKDNGVTSKTKHQFHIKTTETEVILYKIVDTMEIKNG